MERTSSITALVSAFSRAYHARNNQVKVFDDSMAERFITEKEYEQISFNMTQGIKFFNSDFSGSDTEALRWIVDNQLSPSPVGRAAYAEKMLENAVRFGAEQYLIFAAGFDTFAYRQPDYAHKLQIFEIDHLLTSADKQERAKAAVKDDISNLHYISVDLTEKEWPKALLSTPEFDKSKISFCSLLGISYYMTKHDFNNFMGGIAQLIPDGSSIVFDYPNKEDCINTTEKVNKQAAMAKAAGESMLSEYSYEEIENILSDNGILIYEHLEPKEITEQYFKEYNKANPKHPMKAFDNVNFCLGVKKKF